MYESEILSLYKFANIKKIPVNLNTIVSALGYRIKTYQETAETEDQMIRLKRISGDAFVVRKNKTIYLNDSTSINERRKRFSVAHEIGHIVLLTNDEDRADEFASNLLAPRPVIYALDLMRATQVSTYFEISVSAANNVLADIKCPHTSDYFPDIYGADIIEYFGLTHRCPELFPRIVQPVPVRQKTITLSPLPEHEPDEQRIRKLEQKRAMIHRKIMRIDIFEKGYEQKYEKYSKQLWEVQTELKYLERSVL